MATVDELHDLRVDTNYWLDVHGSKKTWLSAKIRCTPSHLHYFLQGERNLSPEKADALRAIVYKRRDYP